MVLSSYDHLHKAIGGKRRQKNQVWEKFSQCSSWKIHHALFLDQREQWTCHTGFRRKCPTAFQTIKSDLSDLSCRCFFFLSSFFFCSLGVSHSVPFPTLNICGERVCKTSNSVNVVKHWYVASVHSSLSRESTFVHVQKLRGDVRAANQAPDTI